MSHQRTGRLVQTKRLGQVFVDFLNHDTQPATVDLATGFELVGNVHRHVDRDRERQAHEATGAGEDLRVDTHHFARHVEQRTTRVTRIDRNVRLDERHIRVIWQAAALGADNAFGHGVIEAERRADRQHPLADFQLVGVTQLDGGKVLAIDLQHRNVGTWIGADQLGFHLAAIRKTHENFVGAINDVVVGQDETISGDDEARAQ